MDYKMICFCELIKEILHPVCVGSLCSDVDWKYSVGLAREHNILPLFVEGAVNYSTYVERPEYESEMQETLTVVASQVKRTNAFLKIYEAFSQKGIYPLVMKGLICRSLYGKLCDHRPSGDEDILIRPSEYKRAKDILIANGYVAEQIVETEKRLENLQEVSFFHPIEKLHIELHLNVMGRENDVRAQMSDYFQNVFDSYREIEICGTKLRTLSHQMHLLYLILHALKHFIGGGCGIRQLFDILLYQEQYGEDVDMNQLHEMLKRFRAEVCWSDLIAIGNEYFGFKLSALQEPNCPRELLEDMMFCGTFGNGTQAQRTAAMTTKFATGNYLKNKKINQLVVIWKTIFPSRVYLAHNAPQLENSPWLLPIEWVKRWGRFIKRVFNNDGNLVNESLEISQKRMNLLKKYDLI